MWFEQIFGLFGKKGHSTALMIFSVCVTINNKMVHSFSPWEIYKIAFCKRGKLFNLPPVATNFCVMKKESVFNVLLMHLQKI